jgi:hypothetical protein
MSLGMEVGGGGGAKDKLRIFWCSAILQSNSLSNQFRNLYKSIKDERLILQWLDHNNHRIYRLWVKENLITMYKQMIT